MSMVLSKKAETSYMFVMLVSIILIVFAGFLVVKFVGGFSKLSDDSAKTKVFELLKRDYTTVFENYGAQKSFAYKTAIQAQQICFISKASCIKTVEIYPASLSQSMDKSFRDEMNSTFAGNNNVMLFDGNGVISSSVLGTFQVPNGCLCVPVKDGKFSLLFENSKNIVFISQLP